MADKVSLWPRYCLTMGRQRVIEVKYVVLTAKNLFKSRKLRDFLGKWSQYISIRCVQYISRHTQIAKYMWNTSTNMLFTAHGRRYKGGWSFIFVVIYKRLRFWSKVNIWIRLWQNYCLITCMWRYNVVHYKLIVYTPLQFLRQNLNQIESTKDTQRVSYAYLGFWKKKDWVITTPHSGTRIANKTHIYKQLLTF